MTIRERSAIIKSTLELCDISTIYNEKRIGSSVRCIFHEDKHKSAQIYPNSMYCFACRQKFGVIDVYMHENNLSYVDAVIEMYNKYISNQTSFKSSNNQFKNNNVLNKGNKGNNNIEATLEDLEELNSYTKRKLQKYLEERHIPKSIAIFKKFDIHFYFSKKDKYKNNIYIKFNENFIITFSLATKKYKGVRGKSELTFLTLDKEIYGKYPYYNCFEGWADALSYIHYEIDNCKEKSTAFINIIILNSVANVNKLKNFMEESAQKYIEDIRNGVYEEDEDQMPIFFLHLDSDEAGNVATEELLKLNEKYDTKNIKLKIGKFDAYGLINVDRRYELLIVEEIEKTPEGKEIKKFKFKDCNEGYCHRKNNQK
ncbi:hypothetical protein AN639_11720 [Candidatus Epulonipiscium fishelsonii]|uniref:Uncharacterized protein n=1 Tax=Candidatus Epulonipiscium fishelsonii TaxID=77094 RepID=A0ACC8XD97_9FIRM|nr:hypothetical protein AN396_05275 [Epulopiscium sp. SCG-B11WGA-EpuloA1]ONI42938.1 hypothetical protein AN639_11720 [Epulopiscium sp. SCG-B05WGA-EpuloA1]